MYLGSCANEKTRRQGRRAVPRNDGLRYFVSWPRISPPLLAAVWTLTYMSPSIRALAWASLSVAEPSKLGPLGLIGTMTPAFLPSAAGPWKWAAVAGPVRPL